MRTDATLVKYLVSPNPGYFSRLTLMYLAKIVARRLLAIRREASVKRKLLEEMDSDIAMQEAEDSRK